LKNKLQIVIPLSGGTQFFDSEEFIYPKPLVEIDGKPMIQWVVENYADIINEGVKVIFVTKEPECTKFNLDYTLKILCPQSKVIKLQSATKGAICTVLMALDELDINAPLLIVNGDQYIDYSIKKVLDYFVINNSDAGVLCFNSVHPKWSYIRPDEENNVLETAEKKPISNKAIAGFYYFAKASLFLNAASKAIVNNQSYNGIFFVSLLMNELILLSKKVNFYEIDSEKYHSFYSPRKIEEFEIRHLQKSK
jgi:NDP-sugar pyrophosphorylase family protein